MANALLADGFVDLCFDTSLNFFDGKCRVLFVGQKTAAGTAMAGELIAVQGQSDINDFFGQTSVLADAMRIAFETCPNNVAFYAVPQDDGAGAVAAEYEMTFTGPATSAGRIDLFLGNRGTSIDVFIPNGSTDAQIATLVEAAIPDDFPYTRAVAGGVITFTAANAGEIGNHLNPVYHWTERQSYLPDGVTYAFAQTTAGTGTVDATDLTSILSGCCYCAVIGLNDEIQQETDIQTYLDAAWSCDTPQCFGHGYVYNCGTVAQVTARGNNAATLSRLDCCPGAPTFPWQLVAAYGSLSACSAVNSPEKSIQGRADGVLTAILEPQSCSSCRTFAEQTTLRSEGFVVTGQLNGGTGSYTSPYIFNDVTNNLRDDLGRENVTFRDANSRRLAAATAVSIAAKLQTFSSLGLFTKNTTIQRGVFGTNPRLILADIRAWAKDNVGNLFSEFDNIDEDITLETDFDRAVPCTGVPGKFHLNFRYIPPVRISEFELNMQPEVLTNCNR